MRARCLPMIVVAVSIGGLVGCGATPNQSHTASTWASSYCSALSDWLTTLDAVSRGIVLQPESTTLNITDLETVSKQVSQATGTLTDALARAGRPESAAAPKVEATVAGLSSSLKRRSDAAVRAAKSNDRSALAGFRRLQAVGMQVDRSLSDILSADSTIRGEDKTLARALASSQACKDFHSDVRNGTRHGNE